LFALDPGNHIHGVRSGRSARLPAQHRNRAARNRRKFSRHEFFTALLAGWPARDHEPAAGRQLKSVRDGPAVEIDHAPDRHAGDRYLAVLRARWQSDLLRVRSWRKAADL